ncbi:MAG: hypothetical protein AAGG02_04575 [Cyanobacteria bacterium P01_H01_bin.15]
MEPDQNPGRFEISSLCKIQGKTVFSIEILLVTKCADSNPVGAVAATLGDIISAEDLAQLLTWTF